MQKAGGEADSPPAKRLRRPSVRLHQPYYDIPGHRKLQHQWKPISTKPRTVKNVHPKSKDNNIKNDKGKEIKDLNSDDNIAIGDWNAVRRGGGDFNRKRVRSSEKSGKNNKHLEIEKVSSTSNGESEEREEEEEEEEEKDLSGNSNLVRKALDVYNPNCSFGNDDKLSDENKNGGGKEGRNGVRMWLNRLGLGKYERLFEVHGVDDQVLPLLTLEDLKDMGIVEVGPRRKMFSSIQKLRTGFP